MADEDDSDEDEAEHAVALGEGDAVEGAPLARVSARLHYGIGRSEVRRREGDALVRTPDGPRELGEVLDEIDATYFDTRRAFEETVREVVGRGPVPVAGEAAGESAGTTGGETADE